MLKKHDLHEVATLFELSRHPDVYPYLRQKANTLDEYYFLTKQMILAEENGELISRTILDEYEQPIGTITLYDLHEQKGFLATWIGQPYFGKGYNKLAKQLFFDELFFTLDIELVFMKVQTTNSRSLKAAAKLSYVVPANDLYPDVHEAINKGDKKYNLFAIHKEHYASYVKFSQLTNGNKEEDVS